jgi:hypothetical protein
MERLNREDVTMGEWAVRGFSFLASAAIHLAMLVALAWTPSSVKTSAKIIPVELLALETGKEKTALPQNL